MFYQIMKCAIYCLLFGAALALVKLYDSNILLLWNEYAVEVSIVFLCCFLFIVLLTLLKLANLFAALINIPISIRHFFHRKKDVNNIKILFEGYRALVDGNYTQAENSYKHLSKSIKDDRLFAPFITDFEKFSTLCRNAKGNNEQSN
jgi:uncharacterized protein HemY